MGEQDTAKRKPQRGKARADGRLEAKVRLANGTRVSVYGYSKKELEEAKAERLRQDKAGIDVRGAKQPLAIFLRDWLDNVSGERNRATTVRGYRSYVEHRIVPQLGAIAVGDLTTQDVQKFLTGLSRDGLSPSTVGQVRRILSSALGVAEDWGLVERNVAARAKSPKAERRPPVVLDRDQTLRLLDHAKGDRIGNVLIVAAFTGMRQGEILGLRWPDIERDTIHVRQQAQRIGGKHVLVPPKSEAGKRSITLPPAVADALSDQRQRNRLAQIADANRWEKHWDLVFPGEHGRPMDGTAVTHRLQRLLEEAGLPRIRFHDLRHGCATLLLEANVNPKIVQAQLGHSQINLTLGTYSHVRRPMLDEAAEAMSRALGR